MRDLRDGALAQPELGDGAPLANTEASCVSSLHAPVRTARATQMQRPAILATHAVGQNTRNITSRTSPE